MDTNKIEDLLYVIKHIIYDVSLYDDQDIVTEKLDNINRVVDEIHNEL